MCTLSWKATNSEYTLFFNRDEQRSRLPALPPSLQQRNGVMFLSPTDAHHQGTWLLVNEYALTICLLNHYPMTAMPYIPNAPSRGLLPLICADCCAVDAAMQRLLATPITSYMPFRFVTFSPTHAAQAIWDGRTITTSTLPRGGGMLTSSSFRSDAVEQFRHATFRSHVGPIEEASTEMLNAFHHHPGSDESSGICMSRPDACTHNITRITVSNLSQQIGLHYEPLVFNNSEGFPTVIDLPLRLPRKLHDHRNTPL